MKFSPTTKDVNVIDYARGQRGGVSYIERMGPTDRLRMFDSRGELLLDRSASRSTTMLSATGKFALVATRKNKETHLEVFDANAKVAWSRTIQGAGWLYEVSDAGKVFQRSSHGPFILYGADGEDASIKVPPSSGMDWAWSPSGNSLLLACDNQARILCVGQHGLPLYEVGLPYKLVCWGRIAFFEDSSVALVAISNLKGGSSNFYSLDSKGNIQACNPVEAQELVYLIRSPTAIAPDGAMFAYVDQGIFLNVVKRDFSVHLRIELPGSQITKRIAFGRSSDELVLVRICRQPIYLAGYPGTLGDEGRPPTSIFVIQNGRLLPMGIEPLIDRDALIRFVPRFDLESGAISFFEGSELREFDFQK